MDPNKVESHEVDQNLDKNPEIEQDDLKVVVEDDTPPEDKGRKPLKKDPLEADPDEEARKYTKGVQKRIGELTHKAHDERRARENAERERDEAVRVAQAAMQHKRMLEQQLTNGEMAFANEAVERTKLAVANAKEKHRKAYESGDPEAIAEAMSAIAAAAHSEQMAKQWQQNAQNKLNQAKNALQQQNNNLNSDQPRVNTQQERPAVDAPDERAQEWAESNPWFGQDRKMTSFVYGVHESLVFDEGINPVEHADKYYARIDEEMRQRFPDYDWGSEEATSKPPAASAPDSRKKTATTTVAPVTRTSTGNPNTVKLTKSEVAMASRLGLTIEQYAREKMKLGV